jgi:ABC-type polar amino acid transport system ATPase subunit
MSKVKLRNVVKRFGENTVCNGVSLDVQQGEMVCLIGASGAGKSTLLRCINLLDPIDDGEIFLDGDDISQPGLDPQAIRGRIGMVFQSNTFRPQVESLFERFNLADRMHNYPDQLSGGQQQRVAIVRALAMRPEVMLFDEITSALDPQLVGEVLDVLLQLKSEGMTMILATHEMGFARQAADKVCFFEDGSILEEGSAQSLFGAPQHSETKLFLERALK